MRDKRADGGCDRRKFQVVKNTTEVLVLEKIRIYELAKELKQDSKTIVNDLGKMNISVKNHMSTVTQEVADEVRKFYHHNDHEKRTKIEAEVKKSPPKNKAETLHKELVKEDKLNEKKERPDKKEIVKDQPKKQEETTKVKQQKKEEQEQKPARNRRQNTSTNQRKTKSKNRRSKKDHRKTQEVIDVKHHVIFDQSITVSEIAHQLGKKASEIIMKLMGYGIMATMNDSLDQETAMILADDYGASFESKASKEDNLLAFQEEEDNPEDLVTRPPVVTIMGHVDHGKTSLLDRIRASQVTSTEAGGITQQIGAYQVEVNDEYITFVDTPGHEAFTSMRARGAQVTDIAILVVAADDGVMPQTVEAIDHAKAADVPIIVAINKIDKPDSNPERIKQDLANYDLISEDWGGDVIMVPVSAKQGTNIDDLLEMVLLVAEMSDLKANPERSALGTVLESELDKSRGPVATLLVQNGTLRNGDFLIVGSTQGRIRAMFDYNGKPAKEAGPSTPVEVLGLQEVPDAGDDFAVVANERLAKQVAEQRSQEKHMQAISRSSVSLEDLFSQIQEGEVAELNIVLKADTQGSIEALEKSLAGLGNDEVRVNVIRTAVGGIRESDVMLAAASQAIIIGFNVRPDANAKRLAADEDIDVQTYRVIYEAIDDVTKALNGLLQPEIKEVDLGQAEVRDIFKVPKVGNVAGCYVTDGKITRNAKIRVLRDSVVIFDGEIASLKRFKDDVREVAQGYECGIGLERFNDFKEGDIFEAYSFEEIERKL